MEWGDVFGAGRDASEAMLKQLAAEKLKREGVIPSVPVATMQPSYYAPSPFVNAQSPSRADGLADAAVVAVILFAVFILFAN